MKIWRSSLFCLEFVFFRVCSLVKDIWAFMIDLFWVVWRIYVEYLYYDLFFWLIRAISWNHLGLANPPLRSWAPLDEVARWGWCLLRVFMGFMLRFTSWWGRRDVKSKYQTNYNLSLCLWFFALHFRALWNTDHLNLKNYTFTCWMDCFKANCLLLSTGFIANWYLANWFWRLVPVQHIFSSKVPKSKGPELLESNERACSPGYLVNLNISPKEVTEPAINP